MCAISIIRISKLASVNYHDPTWRLVDVYLWTSLENSVGIASACLPTMREYKCHLAFWNQELKALRTTLWTFPPWCIKGRVLQQKRQQARLSAYSEGSVQSSFWWVGNRNYAHRWRKRWSRRLDEFRLSSKQRAFQHGQSSDKTSSLYES